MLLLEWFKRSYPELVLSMKESDHDYSLDSQSIHHMEGDVWTHTMMVYRYVQDGSIELRLTSLLHDIGKPVCRNSRQKVERASFYNHQYVSSYMAIDIINQYELDFNVSVNKELILKTINWHQEINRLGYFDDDLNFFLYDEDVSFLNRKYFDLDFYILAVAFAKADDYGRISSTYREIEKRMNYLENFIPETLYVDKDKKNLQPHFIMMSGISCSGKSTWVDKFLKESTKEYTIISLDDIIMEKSQGMSYDFTWSPKRVQKGHKVLFERFKEAIKNKENIILDMTNLDEEQRNRKVNIVPDKHYFKEAVVILQGASTIHKNNMKRKKDGKYIPPDVIEKQAKNFEYPSNIDFHNVKFII